MLVSLYTSRVVLNTLGIENYGIYNVVGGMVTLFGFFNGAMSSATQRFLSIDLGRNDNIQLRKTFNATQIIHLGISLIILILAETIGLWFLNNYLNLPEGRMDAARWVYHFSVFSFMITILQVPYNALIIAHERMSIYAHFSILDVLLKLLSVFMLTWVLFDKLKLYAILIFFVSLIMAAVYRMYSIINFTETKFLITRDKSMYKTLIGFSGWNLFGGVAGVAKVQGVSILLNIFFGTVINAALGIATQIFAMVNLFVNNFQMASNPQIIKSYAAEDKKYMVNLIIRTSKFSFYLLFIITLPVILEIDYILKIWLKLVPYYTSSFTILILINAVIDTISGPLMTALQATGKIKVYQSVVGILLVLILPMSYLLFSLGFPPQSTFNVSIAIAIIAFIIRLLLTKKQLPEFSVKQFLHEVLLINVPVILISIAIPSLIIWVVQPGLFRLIFVTIASLNISIVIIYLIGLKNNEKYFIKEAILGLILKIKHRKNL